MKCVRPGMNFAQKCGLSCKIGRDNGRSMGRLARSDTRPHRSEALLALRRLSRPFAVPGFPTGKGIKSQPGTHLLDGYGPDALNDGQIFGTAKSGCLPTLLSEPLAVGHDHPGPRQPNAGESGQTDGRGIVGIDLFVNGR